MQRTKPPFRADQVGSLLRSAALRDARSRRERGEVDAAALRQIEDEEIKKLVAKQEAIGLKSITDGEYRRASWQTDFLQALDGIETKLGDRKLKFQGGVQPKQWVSRITEKLGRFSGHPQIEQFRFLLANTKETAKVTIPSPSALHFRQGRAAVPEDIYPEMDAFWHDLAEVYAKEIAGLAALGCTYLQLDDTSLAYLNDPAQRAYVTSIGGDGSTQHLTNIRLINQALAEKPAGMTVCTHMCRGNFRSSWMAEGGYDHVAEALFGELAVDGFFLEYDDARSGGFAPLRFVPRGPKKIVLGLVTTKRAALESKDELKRRIDEAAKYVPLEQLCLSPQCGFSSTVEGNALTIEEEKAKLRLVVEVAREVWG